MGLCYISHIHIPYLKLEGLPHDKKLNKTPLTNNIKLSKDIGVDEGLAEELWGSFASQLQKMEEESKINVSVIPTIQGLIENCQENENWWIHNTTQSQENNFAPYHALRNVRLILINVENSLKTAEARNSNPIDVENALSMVPILSSLHMFVNSVKNKTISDIFKRNIYSQTRQLRNIASRYSFLPSLEDEIGGINKRTLQSRITRLSKTFQKEIDILET